MELSNTDLKANLYLAWCRNTKEFLLDRYNHLSKEAQEIYTVRRRILKRCFEEIVNFRNSGKLPVEDFYIRERGDENGDVRVQLYLCLEGDSKMTCTIYTIDLHEKISQDGKIEKTNIEPTVVARESEIAFDAEALDLITSFMCDFPDALVVTERQEIWAIVPKENPLERQLFCLERVLYLISKNYKQFDFMMFRKG